jgi:hypothetical protein
MALRLSKVLNHCLYTASTYIKRVLYTLIDDPLDSERVYSPAGADEQPCAF